VKLGFVSRKPDNILRELGEVHFRVSDTGLVMTRNPNLISTGAKAGQRIERSGKVCFSLCAVESDPFLIGVEIRTHGGDQSQYNDAGDNKPHPGLITRRACNEQGSGVAQRLVQGTRFNEFAGFISSLPSP